MFQFNVTFETITPESAEHGDVECCGFEADGVTLREAIDYLGSPDNGFEASEYPVSDPRWITAYKVAEDFTTGCITNRHLHFPNTMTAASKLRVCRLLGVYGVN